MSNNRLATVNIVLDCNCMYIYSIAIGCSISFFLVVLYLNHN